MINDRRMRAMLLIGSGLLVNALAGSIQAMPAVPASGLDDTPEGGFNQYLGPDALPTDDHMFLAGFFSYVGLSPMMDFFSERACGIPYEPCEDSTTTRVPTVCAAENLPLLKQGLIDESTFYVNQGFFVPSVASCANPVVRPDNGHLYVNVWYDLSNGPVRISYPELRFPSSDGIGQPAVFAVQFLDPFSNNIFHIAPWGNLVKQGGVYGQDGRITTSNVEAGFYDGQDYYVYWTGMDGLDSFLEQSGIPERNLIASDNKLGWMLGRVIVQYDQPDPTRVLCGEFCGTAMVWDEDSRTLSELDLASANYGSNPLPPKDEFSVTCGSIPEPLQYLDYAATCLGQVTWPDGVVNDYYRYMMDSIGVNPDVGGPSKDPNLGPEDKASIIEGFRYAESLLCGSGGSTDDYFTEGSPDVPWVNPLSSTGNYGQKLFYRAVVAQQGFGAETNTYEYYPTAKKDSDKDKLVSWTDDGDFNEYLIVMDADIEDVSAMWSLTMYYSENADQKTAAVLCPEQNNSCLTGTCVTDIGTFHSNWEGGPGPIKFNDKYLILLSPEPPSGELADKVNWLPSPNRWDPETQELVEDTAVYFNITLRVYNARITGSSTLSNHWTTPCILKWDRSNGLPLDCSDGAVTGCLGDLDADGSVGANDLAILFQDWGCQEGCDGDLDGNRTVDGRDVARLVNAWGPCGG